MSTFLSERIKWFEWIIPPTEHDILGESTYASMNWEWILTTPLLADQAQQAAMSNNGDGPLYWITLLLKNFFPRGFNTTKANLINCDLKGNIANEFVITSSKLISVVNKIYKSETYSKSVMRLERFRDSNFGRHPMIQILGGKPPPLEINSKQNI